ncbi:MAG: cation transporter [Bacteroidetes bacterium]|nr:cation transporter [Bacteroidota bacterium]
MSNKKAKAARLSVFSNAFLIVMNLAVGLISGSVSIISEAIHTFIDFLAAIMAYFSVRIADSPPDERHPYGHGKYENISGVVEALLIFVASGWIIYHAIQRLTSEHIIDHDGLALGFIVMVISAVIDLFVSRHLYRIAKETDSIALKADALHLSVHVYTSLGIGISLAVIYFTGWHFLDPIAAIVVAAFILKEAFEILVEAFKPLIDNALPEEEVKLIVNTIEEFKTKEMNFHMLRTRKAGSNRELDFHLEVPGNMTVKESHDFCDSIEEKLKKKLPNLEITIHVEPIEYKVN